MAVTWPRDSLGLGEHGIEVDDARDWLARISATTLALARAEAGWIARTADSEMACALAERAAEDVDSADLLFKRQYGLRAFPQEMTRDSRIVPSWVRSLGTAPDLLAFLVTITRVVKPWLLAECRRYRSRTAPNADGPTLRQVGLIVPEIEQQMAWGAEAIADLTDGDSRPLAAAMAWATELEQEMLATGGFFGETMTSDSLLWPSLGAVQSDLPTLRQLAVVVYHSHDLPWDAQLGLAKHLGDFGRHARRGELSGAAGDLPLPSDTSSLLDRLSRLADLLDQYVGQVGDESALASRRYVAASAQVAAAHARECVRRLGGTPPRGGA